MTYNEIVNIAKRLDKDVKLKIDKEVEERLEILKEGDLDQEDMEKMEECLYMSLVLQEYLDGEYELLDEERNMLLAEMEEMYNEYGDLLTKAKLEEKLSKKKRMALELMRIREQLFSRKDLMKDVNKHMKDNRNNKDELKGLSDKDKMKELAKDNKAYKEKGKWGLDRDSGVGGGKTPQQEIKDLNRKVDNLTKEQDKLKQDYKDSLYDVANSRVGTDPTSVAQPRDPVTPVSETVDRTYDAASMVDPISHSATASAYNESSKVDDMPPFLRTGK